VSIERTDRPELLDPLQQFLNDIRTVDLLTSAQEVELAKRIERGDHQAKQEMVEANLGTHRERRARGRDRSADRGVERRGLPRGARD
jgi:hypothetical protein